MLINCYYYDSLWGKRNWFPAQAILTTNISSLNTCCSCSLKKWKESPALQASSKHTVPVVSFCYWIFQQKMQWLKTNLDYNTICKPYLHIFRWLWTAWMDGYLRHLGWGVFLGTSTWNLDKHYSIRIPWCCRHLLHGLYRHQHDRSPSSSHLIHGHWSHHYWAFTLNNGLWHWLVGCWYSLGLKTALETRTCEMLQ